MENNGEQFLKAYFVLLLLPLGVRGKRSLSFNNLDSWLTFFYVLETLSAMLVHSHAWFGLIQFSQALLLWNDFIFERRNSVYILSDLVKTRSQIVARFCPIPSFIQSSIHHFFKTHQLLVDSVLSRSGPRARAILPETSLRNKSEQDRRPGPLRKAKVWMPKKA